MVTRQRPLRPIGLLEQFLLGYGQVGQTLAVFLPEIGEWELFMPNEGLLELLSIINGHCSDAEVPLEPDEVSTDAAME